MKENFGLLPSGETASLYTLRSGLLTATVSDFGANLVSLWVPDKNGNLADVVLGFDDAAGYAADSKVFFGATVGRNANRIAGAAFVLNNKTWSMTPNENQNNLHSGPDYYHHRMWDVVSCTDSSIKLHLFSPDGDQGFPGNAHIYVTYSLVGDTLHISYDGVSDADTVFNMTNHSYFNLAGHTQQEDAYKQVLSMPARFYTVTDAENIPTGENRNVAGTPIDFRTPKPIGRDVFQDYESLVLANGYDHNFEVFCNPCAILTDPGSGRSMAISTDCPGVQFYSGNFTEATGKGGVVYAPRCGICLETQFYPDSVHHPEWPQPFYKAGEKYHSETSYRFSW